LVWYCNPMRRILLLFLCICVMTVVPAVAQDIRLHPDSVSSARADVNGAGFATISVHVIPWTDGVLPVLFRADVEPWQRVKFMRGCEQWSAVANVRCVPYAGQSAYVFVTRDLGGGCWAYLGAPLMGGASQLNMDDTCWGGPFDFPHTLATIVHELGHAFGLIHEHQRVDRDHYIQVFRENLVPTADVAFNYWSVNYPQGPYDYQSIMHYMPVTFAVAGQVAFRPLNYTGSVGGVTVSPQDGADMRTIYGGPRLTNGPTVTPVSLELVTSSNPVTLRWTGGVGNYTILAGTVPGGSDVGIFPMGSAQTVTAYAPTNLTIYVTIVSGEYRSNTVTVFVP
jgi:hypothetical protein